MSSPVNQKSFATIALIVAVVIIIATGGYFAWIGIHQTSTQGESVGIEVQNAQYTPVKLEQVKTYTQKSATDFIVTSGKVVGINLDQSSLLIDDSDGNYVLVNFARAFRSTFLPIYSNLKIGDMLEVSGSPSFTNGNLVSSSNGKMVQTVGIDSETSANFGMITINKIKKTNFQADISNWKTYKNTEFSFSMKYPSNFGDVNISEPDHVLYSGRENIDGPLIKIGPYTVVPTKDSTQKKSMESWIDRELGRVGPDEDGIYCQNINVPNTDTSLIIKAVHCEKMLATFALIKNGDIWVFFHSVPSATGQLSTEAEELKTLLSFKFTDSNVSNVSLIQGCPEHWYLNAMLGTVSSDRSITKEYYVYKNVRREISEFDSVWVSKNCNLVKETIY